MTGRVLLAVAAACCTLMPAAPVAAASTLSIPSTTMFGMRVIALHNQVRWAAGVRPMQWDRGLAAAAEAYAARLASTGRWGHSPEWQRPGQGENLWMGTHGAFSVDQMLTSWSSERRMFRSGAFPRVSKTGSWDDVGHYTQMIWPGSVRVGCAVRSSGTYDYLVCRYSPGGNVMGSRVP
jgi:Cysteine-rich secretory protein family